ncbi:interleukin-17A-like [Pseudophryne corroboree]|uniref:interleukin-17A-like n=1 Tax=Pseudophryne corroboree TaxID=495146 RepID=UPI003081304A
MAALVSVCSSAFLPEGYLSEVSPLDVPRDEDIPTEPRDRCTTRRSRRLPTSMTVDISVIDASYLGSRMGMEDLHTRSLSPWGYRLNTDPSRFPSVVAEAHCLRFTCVDWDGNESPELISYPIQQEILVLRREQKSCDYTYTLETELVTLGSPFSDKNGAVSRDSDPPAGAR